MVTEGRNAGGGEVTRTGVLAKLPNSSSGALELDMDGSEYKKGSVRKEKKLPRSSREKQ